MIEEDPVSRVLVAVRLRPESVERVETAAAQLGVSKSAVYREAFALGLPLVEERARREKKLRKR